MSAGRARIFLGAFGDAGHAFPMIALGRALLARGHDVWLQTWRRWEASVKAEGMRFAAAPEYPTGAIPPGTLGFYEAVERATRETAPLIERLRPDVVVADILTLAPALAAELADIPWATLVPHAYPTDAPGLPVYSIGARLPRTALGRAFWELAKAPLRRGVERGRSELNETRARVGLAPLAHCHGGISTELAIVATFPQLEYPRAWPAGVHVVGPLLWEPPGGEVAEGIVGAAARGGPAREAPLVLIAPSTAQDPRGRLLRAALEGLESLPVRVLASRNRRAPLASDEAAPRETGDVGRPAEAGGRDDRPPRGHRAAALPEPANAALVEWLSYARAMPLCDVVVCHAGHGTLARALAAGRPVVACPVAGDMNENAARLAWAGAGVRLPRRFVTARTIRGAVERVLEDREMSARAQALSRWAAEHDPAGRAAGLVESLLNGRRKLGGWDSNPQPRR